MEVKVKMTAEEFQAFMAWRTEKDAYHKELDRLRRVPEFIASSLHFAVEPVAGKEDRYKIVSQEHMADVMDMIEEFKDKKETTCARC